MPLFREPPPPPPKANETLGEKTARLSRQPAPPPPGRGYALLAIGVIVIGGLVYSSFTGGDAVTKTMKAAHEKAAQDAANEEASKPRADTTAPSPTARPASPQPTLPTAPPGEGTAVPPPAPGPDAVAAPRPAASPAAPPPLLGDGMEIDLADIVAKVRLAPAADRPMLRRSGLELFVEVVRDPRARRATLLQAAYWGPDATPDEAGLFARITKVAMTDGLASPTDAQAALLFLGSLRDRGGVEAVVLVENLVLDEKRPLELRVAAARILPADSRPRIAKKIAERPGPHPVLLSALK